MERSTICLWDFSWYTLAGPGEPYADLERVLDETQDLGYTTVRICAAPLLLAGGLGLDDLAESLPIEGLGVRSDDGYYGERTRWYAVPGGYATPIAERLLQLLDGLGRRGMTVILSSWEYQQSAAFAGDRRWHDAITAVPMEERLPALARAFTALLHRIRDAGLLETVALVELHNEIDFSLLPAFDAEAVRSVDAVRREHPSVPVTISMGKPPHLAMHRVPAGLDAGQFHVYSYGVLDALQAEIDIRLTASEGFPNAALRSLQRADAPSWAEYGRPAAWKLEATVVTDQMFYGYDTIDADRWDTWLLEHYGPYREVMRREIESRTIAIAEWGRWRGVPTLVGEGWIGYTPLHGRFEEGPVGRALAEHGIATAWEQGVTGVVTCSNAAPHHPMWTTDAAWQRRMNQEFLR